MAEEEFECTIVFLPAHGFFWITFTGELSLSRLTRAHQEFVSHPDYFVGVDELLDFSQTSLRQMTRSDIDRVREYALGATNASPGKNVLVVNSDLEYGLGRMIAGQLGRIVPEQRQICFSLHEALEWLRPGQADALVEAYRQQRSR